MDSRVKPGHDDSAADDAKYENRKRGGRPRKVAGTSDGQGMDKPGQAQRHPLDVLAGTISVSYRERLDRATLDAMLRDGRFDDRWAGHVMTMVEETPVEMLARAVASYPTPEQDGVVAGLQALGRAIGTDRIERWMAG